MITRSIAAMGITAALGATPAGAQVFEVIEPEVESGSFELEFLNGVAISDIEEEEARSAHEIGLGYAPTDFWSVTFAFEIENEKGESAEFDG